MEIITGRITADATVNTTRSGKEVVNFSIAINDGYKPKGGTFQEITTYVNCAYWLSTKATNRLRKGVMVQLYGRIGMNVFTKNNGEAAGSITCHVNDFKTLSPIRGASNGQHSANLSNLATAAVQSTQGNDDLPF
ncbi:MAG: single-stranded DNA-binding protein [Candidatus Pedobacter colombiensis]|uniref:Single-stranded DNA-binding protein n=1 Tax=Candidatus Pedobacter colombiensis TaxID=3121371 RepID=A0AAJ6B594_9SPHI|nr:single-stranded DNA-binding protein [Pedobacter sp.]WEK17940.1 MAG: single-stranded DNA-binding protein [Pedobacter sp.]